MAYEKLIQHIMAYLQGRITSAEAFCNEYMDLYYDLSGNLAHEVNDDAFDVFDDINWLCDSYEDDEAIREADKYCIGEEELKEKLVEYVKKLNTFTDNNK